MTILWIALSMAVAVAGGWPVTAGILKLAGSSRVRAVDAAGSDPLDAGRIASSGAVSQETAPQDQVSQDQVSQEQAAQASGGEPESEPADVPVAREHARIPPRPGSPPRIAQPQVLRGGLLIGFLERGAVTLAILAGQPVAIAYVVAIKGLGRYPELKDTPAASERFIIGTLASMLWAASVAALTRLLLDIR